MLKWERLFGQIGLHRLSRSCSSAPSSSAKEIVVQTTGYTFKHRDGRLVAKYGMWFGEGDARNRWEEIRGRPPMNYYGARLYGVIQAIKMLEDGQNIKIKTDLKLRGWTKLKKMAAHDFVIPGAMNYMYKPKPGRSWEIMDKIENADLLEELYDLVKDNFENITLDYSEHPKGEPNPVAKLLEAEVVKKRQTVPQDAIEFSPGDFLDALEVKKLPSPADWPTVFTGGLVDSTSKGFLSASYATVWPGEEVPPHPPSRLNLFPISLFRAELSAILEALEQAKRAKLERLVVVTSCPYFLRHWKNGWKTIDGKDVANSFLYKRIYHMVNQEMKVVFHYAKEDKEAPVWEKLEEECEKGLLQPMMKADKSVPDMEEILDRKCPEVQEIRRVRHFKRQKAKTNLLWDKKNASEETTHQALEFSQNVDILLSILKQVEQENVDRLIIRTDSPKLIKEVERWMPVWKRNSWRNGRNEFLDRKWEQADQLLSKVQIYWELMDPPSEEDKEELKRFTAKKKTKKETKKAAQSKKEPLSVLEEFPIETEYGDFDPDDPYPGYSGDMQQLKEENEKRRVRHFKD